MVTVELMVQWVEAARAKIRTNEEENKVLRAGIDLFENSIRLAAQPSATGKPPRAVQAALAVDGATPARGKRREKKGLVRDRVLKVLARGRQMTLDEIEDAVTHDFGDTYARTSISSVLKRERKKGRVELDGINWKLRAA